jgi:hypothetical protein
LNAEGLKWTHPNRLKILSYFANPEGKIKFFVGKEDMAVADSGKEKGGGVAGWDRTGGGGGVWAGRRPISFPGRSSPSRTSGPWNRSGSGRNTGVRCGRLWAAPGWANGGGQTCRRQTLSRGTERGSGGRLGKERRPWGGRGRGCSGLFYGLGLTDLLVALDEVLRLLERPWVNQVPEVARQLAEEEDSLGLLRCGWLKGREVIPHDGGPCVATHRIFQPSTRHLGGAEAVRAQKEFLQLLVRVAEGRGVPGQRVDSGDQRKREFRQHPVELHELLRDLAAANIASMQLDHDWGESA